MLRSLAAILIAFTLLQGAAQARAEDGLIAVVNDHPITGLDIDQRIKLLNFLGFKDPAKLERKAIANALIDDWIKIDEATLGKLNPTDKEVDQRVATMAKTLNTDAAGLSAKLTAAGTSVDVLRRYATAQFAMDRLLQGKFHEKLSVDPKDVDKKFAEIQADINGKVAKIESDPARRPVKVIELQEINFPVEGNDPQLLQSRAIEAAQVAQKVTSCGNIKAAASGIFNVQVGKKIEADGRKLPPPLKAQIDKQGIGHAVGPIRYANGIQLLAYCGSRMVTPPKLDIPTVTKQQVQNVVMNEKYSALEQKYVAQMRKTAIIEYKDPSYAQ